MDCQSSPQQQTYRITPKKCCETLKIILSVFLVIGDIITDLIYAFKVEFYSEELRGLCILFITILPFCIYVGFLSCILYKVTNFKKQMKDYLSLILLSIYWFFFGSILSLMYPVLEKFEKFAPNDYRLFFQLSAIEILIESLPQLFIQGLNNTLLHTWTDLTIISFAISGLNLLRGSYILSTIMYRRQYEDYINQIENEVIEDVKKQMSLYVNSEDYIEKIKIQFNKIFHPSRMFNKECDTCNKSQKLHLSLIIKKLEKHYKQRFSHTIDKSLIFQKLTHLPYTFLMIEFFMVLSIWLLNIIYLIFADFYDQTLRFILFLFLSFGYIISTAGKFENNESISFKKYLLARICIVSHFDKFIELVFDKSVKTSYNLIFETLTLFLCCLPVFIIIAFNNSALNKSDVLYSTTLAFNMIWLVIVALRIFQILISRIYFKEFMVNQTNKLDQAFERKLDDKPSNLRMETEGR